MKELNRLRDEWAIGRGNAEFGGDAGWVVCRDVGEDSVERIGWGKTVKAAIDAAEAYVAEEERREAAWRADYERRRAAGELTPSEFAGSWIPSIWNDKILQAVTFDTVVARDYEGEIAEAGDVIEIPRLRDLS
jgi:hypothetical protein